MKRVAARIAQRYAAVMTVEAFAADFFHRFPDLKKWAPSKIIGKDYGGGESQHPEASQQFGQIQLYPKFWDLDEKTRDFVFAHEIGHYTQSEQAPGVKFLELAERHGIDPWDTDKLPFGQHNMDEAFADCFADYFMNRSDLTSRYPMWDSLLQEIVG